MSYWDDLKADVERRFGKIVRDQAVLDAVPVTELSDAELAYQVARKAAEPQPVVVEAPAEVAVEPEPVAENPSV